MAQQVLPAIRLRRPTEGTQRGVEQIKNLLRIVGEAENKRRERQTLDRIVRAIGAGQTDIEAIASVAREEPTFGGGFRGGLQKIAGLFGGEGGGIESQIQQSIIGNALQKALSPPGQIPSGLEPVGATRGPTGQVTTRFERPGVGGVAAPTKQQTQRDRDLAVIGNDKKSDFQKAEARKRLDKDPSQPRNPIPEGGNFDEFLVDEEKEKGKFGKRAYDATLQRVEDEARKQGLNPKDAKADFDKWWDARVKNERTGALGGALTKNVTTPRSEFQKGVVEDNTLDEATAAQILQEAGGDKDKAREIARQRGLKF